MQLQLLAPDKVLFLYRSVLFFLIKKKNKKHMLTEALLILYPLLSIAMVIKTKTSLIMLLLGATHLSGIQEFMSF